jgi:rubrerythrin
MQGGIKAWNGITATGPPEMGMAYFSHTDKIEDLLSLAWSLEEGMRLFYESLLVSAEGDEEKKIFDWLNKSEISHQSRLSTLYDDIPGKAYESIGASTESLLSEDGVGSVMEGGMKTGEAISWTRSRPIHEILEFAIALEAQLYDLYMRLKQRVKQGDQHTVFSITAEEEKKHLEKLVELFESRI